MPMGSEQNNPTNLLGWEPWPHATPGDGDILSPYPRPFADGHLGTWRTQAVLSASCDMEVSRVLGIPRIPAVDGEGNPHLPDHFGVLFLPAISRKWTWLCLSSRRNPIPSKVKAGEVVFLFTPFCSGQRHSELQRAVSLLGSLQRGQHWGCEPSVLSPDNPVQVLFIRF